MLRRRRLTTFGLLLAVAAAVVALGCGDDKGSASSGQEVTAVATTMQVADMTRAVGGDRVMVEGILGPSADPHGYEPRPSDVSNLADADVVVRSGGELDEWLSGVLDNAGGDARTVTLLDSTAQRKQEGDVDPHWWQDPRNAVRAVASIKDALIETDPAGRATYERNAANYTARLERLDREIARCVDRLPRDKRKLVTTHDAFGYYTDRYGLELIGALIPSRSTQAQPSAGEVDRLVRQIERERVEAIFPESALSPKLDRAVAREAGADVGSALWSDTLGKPGSDGATYIGSLRSNTEKIVDGLSGGRVSCRPRG
jgi:ABC-type Zn uptake system ZnuABC Zn-binding protein ZnuA